MAVEPHDREYGPRVTIRTRLKQFTGVFANETVLRGALHDLLGRLPNVKSVQVTHGTQELGKDLVFTGTGPLGEPVHSACVAKNTAISGAVESPRGAATVLHQVRQSLTNPIISSDGSQQWISRVYVMSPHPITQTALRSIQGQLTQYPGQVLFFCGSDLLSLFEKYYPEFILLKSGFLSSYIDVLRRATTEPGPFEHLAFKHGMLALAKLQTSRAYVRPTFSTHIRSCAVFLELSPLKVSLGRGIRLNDLEDIEAFLSQTAELARYHRCASLALHEPFTAASGKTEQDLLSFAQTIRDKWERGLKERGGERRAVRIPLEGLQEALDLLVTNTARWGDKLQSTAQEPLAYLTRDDVSAKALAGPEYQQYGVFRELSKLRSDACRLGRVLRSIKCGDTLIEDLECPLLITAPAGYGKTSFCLGDHFKTGHRGSLQNRPTEHHPGRTCFTLPDGCLATPI